MTDTHVMSAVLRALPEPSVVVDLAGRVLAANPPATRLLRLDPMSVQSASLAEMSAAGAAPLQRFLRTAAETGSMVPGALDLKTSGDERMRVGCRACRVQRNGLGGPGAVLIRFERKPESAERFLTLTRTVEELRKEAAERRAAEESLRESETRALFLAEASEILASSLDYETTLRNVARLAVPRLADWCAVDILDESGELVRLAVEHVDPAKVEFAYQLQERFPPKPNATRGAAHVSRTGRSELVEEIDDDLLKAVAVNEEHYRLLRTLGLRSYVGAPLVTPNGTVGALTLVSAESGETYTEADLRLVEDLGRRAGTAIENARLFRDLEEAHDQIRRQAVELEAQATELQTQAMHLEEQAVELERQVEEGQELNEALMKANADLEVAIAEAEAARFEADRANSAKSQFLTVMSHELRTPMNAILGYTDLLDEEIAGKLNLQQKNYLSRIRTGSNHLLGLINQVLRLARIEAGREELEVAQVDAAELVRDVVSMVEPLARRKGLEVRLDLPQSPLTITTDPGKVRQILMNLFSNAVKFTREGSIEVSLESTRAGVNVHVNDTGIGIAEGDLDKVFVAFEQLRRELSSEAEGTGLGLAVSRELARLLGGEITAESEVGRGSRFTLRLPKKPES